jgi:hypothetical protein
MRRSIHLLAAILAGLLAGTALAANGDGGCGTSAGSGGPTNGDPVASGGGQAAPALTEILGDQDQLRTRDPLQDEDPDQLKDQDQIRDQLKDQHLDQLKDREQDQTQDRLHQTTE